MFVETESPMADGKPGRPKIDNPEAVHKMLLRVPVDTYEKIVAQAKAEKRSVHAQVLTYIEQSLGE